LKCFTCGNNLVGRRRVFFKDGKPYCSHHCSIQGSWVSSMLVNTRLKGEPLWASILQ
jgi:hypothetical protein